MQHQKNEKVLMLLIFNIYFECFEKARKIGEDDAFLIQTEKLKFKRLFSRQPFFVEKHQILSKAKF